MSGYSKSGDALCKTVAFLAAVLISSAILSSTAVAGERLRLQTGDVDLTDATVSREKVPAFSVRVFAAADAEADVGLSWVGTKEKRPKERLSKKVTLRGTKHFVVQMRDRITANDLLNIRSLKIEVLRYLPDDALVVSASPNEIQVLGRSSPSIRAISLYRPEWKLSPALGASSVFSGDPRVQAVLFLFPGEEAELVASRFKKSDCRVLSAAGRTITVDCPRSLLQAVASGIDEVEWIEPEPQISSAWFQDEALRSRLTLSTGDYADLTGFESGTKLLGFDEAEKRGFQGADEAVAFADTGLDRGDLKNIHTDFSGRVGQPSIFGLFSKSWEDPDGHGTHVAGLIAGSGEASGRRIQGGALGATLVPQSLWSPKLGNMSIPARVKDMFGKAFAAGARIHTNSWGSIASLGVYDSMAQQVDEYVHANPEFLVLFAAGNGGEDLDRDGRIDGGSIAAPGTAKNVLTVGASKNQVLKGGIQAKMIDLKLGRDRWSAEPLASSRLSDNDRGLAAFSSRGPTQDGRLKPEVVAPGTNILSTRSQSSGADVLWGAYNDMYVWSGGTSMSTPLVAAAAAVVREYLIKDRKIASPTAAMVKGVLMHSADDLFPGQFGAIGASRGQELIQARPNFDEGFGRVDLKRATALSQALMVDERNGLGPEEQHLYPVTLSRFARLEMTLVYTDVPGAAAAAHCLVNDLDIAVIDRAGRRIEVLDRKNNFEHLEVELPAGGYQIEVRGFNVPIGKQPYALIVSVR